MHLLPHACAGQARPSLPCWHQPLPVGLHHACAVSHGVYLCRLCRPAPLPAAELVALMCMEEVGHAPRAEVGRAKPAVGGMDGGVGENDTVVVHRALDVAQKHATIADVVRVVAERLHASRLHLCYTELRGARKCGGMSHT